MGKVYEDYTVGDLIRLDLSFLVRNRSEEGQQEQRDAFSYLISTASAASIDITKWKLLPDFGLPDTRGFMTTDRAKINQVLFTKAGMAEGTEEEDHSDIPFLENKKTIGDYEANKALLQEKLTRTVRDYEDSIRYRDSHLRIAADHSESARTGNIERLRLAAAINCDDSAGKLFAELCKVHRSPNWNFLRIDGCSIEFHTTAPCIQSEVNIEAGISQVLNCGYIIGRLHMGNMELNAKPFVGNYKIDSKMHPHVSSRGDICFGDAANNVRKLRDTREIGQIFEILYQLLNTYAPENPYIALDTMIEDSSKPLVVRKDIEGVPDTFVSGLDPAEYEVTVPWDTTTVIGKNKMVVIYDDSGSVEALGLTTSESRSSLRVRPFRYDMSDYESRMNIDRKMVAPFDITNQEHRDYLENVEGLNCKGHLGMPVAGTVLSSTDTGFTGRLVSHGGYMSRTITQIRLLNSTWNVRLHNPRINDMEAIKIRDAYVLPCQDNYDLGWTDESIREWNSKDLLELPLGQAYKSLIGDSLYSKVVPDKCGHCGEKYPEDAYIDADGDVRCSNCRGYTVAAEDAYTEALQAAMLRAGINYNYNTVVEESSDES